ncbi:hypothetical protein T01_9995, partial [Trichinella spiralis]
VSTQTTQWNTVSLNTFVCFTLFSAYLEKHATGNRRDLFHCTLLIVSDRLMPMHCIFGGRPFSGKWQNFMVLRIFTIHPVTAACAERSFTAMKYLKSYFWTTMTEERLNGLAFRFYSIINFLLVKYGSTAQNFTRQDILFYGILNISQYY